MRTVLTQCKRIVVKVGSSLVTDDQSLSEAKIDGLAEEISRLQKEGREMVITSSGAIVAGMGRLGLNRRPQNIPEKQAAAAVGQGYLMAAWEQAFRRHGLQVAQVLLTGGDLADRRRFINAQNTLAKLLEYRVVPVINENDTVAVDEIRVGDNDTLSATVAVLVGADLLVILSDIEGLYTGDPRHNPKSELIPTVRGVDAALIESAGDTLSAIGTGGMRTKLVAARRVNDYGIPMAITSGQDAGNIGRLLSGETIGTVFLPAGRRIAGKKHWIRHTLAAAGDILVDAGAAKALLRGGKSLLPAGVTGTRGEFAAGDPVRIVLADGKEIARGLTRYSSAEIAGIKGLTSERLRCLGCHREDEVVHRDELVVTSATGNDVKR